MGVTYDNGIKNFWPDDTDDTMYLVSPTSLNQILEVCAVKWNGVDFSDIEITSEKIHTSCLTYDLYDPSDYTDFVIVRNLC